ncbi:hypothetical protein H310_12924 [Aphanomyces invadans]|uniref:Uncharacterized protein n=1 Tax=Aphanomyces invadans TaxID=157072 RepID=A0A024TH75_9STRA|nr:hypothetical protein H310_12924 [Aphanomyces invadans]ETV92911.1 hypothetical protein H310_12924 [Aphanomyces invadans]|eukprot:XP_008878432.1 hypothetical protein H310_12924 [Aphanomyces invadans]
MGDNLFEGLNMDFNFADTLVPPQGMAHITPPAPAPPGGGRHKRHKSSPDVLGQFSFASFAVGDWCLAAPIEHTPMHYSPATQSIPFMSEAVPCHATPSSTTTNPPPSSRGLSFIQDIDLDDILQDFLHGPELVPSATVVPPTSSTPSMPICGSMRNRPWTVPHPSQLFHAHQLHETVLDLKRKCRHERHQSNPDGLFYHAQQLRQLQQQLHSPPDQQPDARDQPLRSSPTAPVLSKAKDSSSIDEFPARPSIRRRSKKRHVATGLSVDMSHIALALHAESSSSAKGSDDAAHESNRKSYKCGRCGQPKVGHVCSLPDLRNNWSQADLAITRGMKPMDATCKVIASRRYTVVHPDHTDHYFA